MITPRPLCFVRPSVRPSVHTLNKFSSEIPGPNFFKLHVEPCIKEGLKICANGYGPLIKMAALPIYSSHRLIMEKTLKNLHLGNHEAHSLNI